jgi:hypothetical protein
MHLFKQTARLAVAGVFAVVAAGCAAERPEEVPGDAIEVSAGSRALSYRAPSDGRIWVIDSDDDNKVIYSGKIDRGDEIRVDMDRNRISLDGDTVFEKDLRSGNQHRIYFDPDGDAERRVIVKERTVIEREQK